MNDFFDHLGSSLYNSLSTLDHSIHKNIKNTVIDDFIHELKSFLSKSDVSYRLSQLPKNSLLEVNEIEKSHVQCNLNHEEYRIPNSMIATFELPEYNDGYLKLQLQDDGLYHVISTKKES